jgi:hypothetical protein
MFTAEEKKRILEETDRALMNAVVSAQKRDPQPQRNPLAAENEKLPAQSTSPGRTGESPRYH